MMRLPIATEVSIPDELVGGKTVSATARIVSKHHTKNQVLGRVRSRTVWELGGLGPRCKPDEEPSHIPLVCIFAAFGCVEGWAAATAVRRPVATTDWVAQVSPAYNKAQEKCVSVRVE